MSLGPFAPIPPREKIRRSHINDLRTALTGIQDAYDVAVANGFVGTRGQWLDSLKGEKGDPGAGLAPIGSVETVDDLPDSGNTVGDVRTVDADGRAYRWSGSAWVDVGLFRGPGGEDTELRARVDPSAAGATNQVLVHTTLGPRWQDDGVIDVRRFAPALDADGTDDWTAAIQDAKAAAEAIHGTLFFPPGIFTTTETIENTVRMSFRGSGFGEAVDPDQRAGTIIRKMDDVPAFLVKSPFSKIEDLCVHGDASLTGVADGIQIGMDDGSNGSGRTTLRDVLVVGRNNHGVNIQNGNTGLLDNVRINYNLGHGLLIDSQHTGGTVGNTNAWTCRVSCVGNGGDGIHLGYAVNNFIDGFQSENNGGWGLYINRQSNRARGYIEDNAGGSYYLGVSAYGCTVDVYVINSGLRSVNNTGNYINETGGINPPGLHLMPQYNGGTLKVQGPIAIAPATLTFANTISTSTNTRGTNMIVATDNRDFTIGNVTLPIAGTRVTFWIVNDTAGALGTLTWSNKYLLGGPWVQPAAGHRRAITFESNGSQNYEVSRSVADVPNG